MRFRGASHQFLEMPDCFRSKKHIGTHVAYFCRHIVDDKYFTPALHRMNDPPQFVIPGASLHTAIVSRIIPHY